ncbi:MAG: hypothetical protein IIC58_05935 [Proteobacteria bacterium]|nr:hypothetical protein [Pseudomonadota bacterium]
MSEHLLTSTDIYLVKLSYGSAITRVPRPDLDWFESQSDSPNNIQRRPKATTV